MRTPALTRHMFLCCPPREACVQATSTPGRQLGSSSKDFPSQPVALAPPSEVVVLDTARVHLKPFLPAPTLFFTKAVMEPLSQIPDDYLIPAPHEKVPQVDRAQ